MGMQKRFCISLVLSLIGLISIHVLSLYVKPVEITSDQLKEFYGRYVRIEGLVKENSLTESKYQVLTILDGKGKEVQVFSYKVVNVSIGDFVVVEGTVEKYMGKWEIVTNGKVWRKSKYQEKLLTLSQLASFPGKFVGMKIEVRGIVKSSSMYGFVLEDGKYAIEVISPFDCKENSLVDVEGKFLYNKRNFSYYILATKVKKIG